MTRLRMGMIGGGHDAFIGAVHRMAARLDDDVELVAGAFGSTPEGSRASGEALGLVPERVYDSWQGLLAGEAERDDPMDFVTVVTPNASHHPIAAAALDGGFPVLLEKPMVTTVEHATDLVHRTESTGLPVGVMYNYSGYPMVQEARDRVAAGELGELRKVVVQYHQGWLATALEASGQKQASWRTNPAEAGVGGATGDIGSHAAQLAEYITGRRIEAVAADLAAVVPGRVLDDDAAMFLRLEGDLRGVASVSQICPGQRNNLAIHVWGERGGLAWQQETPETLGLWDEAGHERRLHRADAGVSSRTAMYTRLPGGHPEAFIEAFANIYRGFVADVRSRGAGAPVTGAGVLYPDVRTGMSGVRFIHAAVLSSREGQRWVRLEDVT